MKQLTILFIAIGALIQVQAQTQDFKTNITTAKTSYAAGKLEDAHFALQQVLQEIDITIGNEVIKLLPLKLDTLNANSKDDRVTGNVGFVGASIHRSYGNSSTGKDAELEIVNNSPLLGTLNAFLTSPLLGAMGGGDPNSKVVKIQGYKSRLTKENTDDKGKTSYRIEIPFSNALITLHSNDSNDADIQKLANTLPLAQIAKLIQ